MFLEGKYRYRDALLRLQNMGKIESNNAFIIDQCSVKRNQILVMSYLLGGVNERVVPPDYLTTVSK